MGKEGGRERIKQLRGVYSLLNSRTLAAAHKMAEGRH
jgi:hypothetical protein